MVSDLVSNVWYVCWFGDAYTCMHMFVVRAHAFTRTRTFKKHKHVHLHTCPYIHIYMYTYMHAYIYTDTYTHTHTQLCDFIKDSVSAHAVMQGLQMRKHRAEYVSPGLEGLIRILSPTCDSGLRFEAIKILAYAQVGIIPICFTFKPIFY